MIANFLPLLALLMRIASEPSANLSYLIIAAYCFFGRSQSIQALALSWFFTMINPALVPEASFSTGGRYLVILCAAISIFLRSEKFLVASVNFLTLLLGLTIILHSLFFSAAPDVSILKICAWLLVVSALLSAWGSLEREDYLSLSHKLRWMLVVLLLTSLPFLAIPSVGYERNGHGFQGLLNHPQAFGLTAALLGSMQGGFLLASAKPRTMDILFFGLCIFMVFLSAARTAGLALLIGLALSVLSFPFFSNRSSPRVISGIGISKLISSVFLVLMSVLLSGAEITHHVSSYLLKGSNEDRLLDAAEASRGVLVHKMLNNINDNFIVGIGFGIASSPEGMKVERDPIFSLPLSAPIEKGVMPLAILEELGLFVGLFVFSWIIFILRRCGRSGIWQYSVAATLLLVNLGEYVFFSVGGMGMLTSILFTWAATYHRFGNDLQ